MGIKSYVVGFVSGAVIFGAIINPSFRQKLVDGCNKLERYVQSSLNNSSTNQTALPNTDNSSNYSSNYLKSMPYDDSKQSTVDAKKPSLDDKESYQYLLREYNGQRPNWEGQPKDFGPTRHY